MNNICDVYNSECIVRPVCSEICELISSLVDSYIAHDLDNAWMFYELATNERCPVCHCDKFWSVELETLYYDDMKALKLECDFCNASYHVKTFKDGEGHIGLCKLMKAWQGTDNGHVNDLFSMKEIKQYLKGD